VLNYNEELSEEDKKILKYCDKKPTIVVINKNDLNKKIDIENIKSRNIVYTNTKTQEGIDSLKQKIIEMFNLEQLSQNDNIILNNIRQISLSKEALKILDEVEKAILNEVPTDMVEIDIKRVWSKLGEIIGETYTEELIDQLFSQFCLGK
jgi:tRNA modification GTPase